MSKKKSLGLDTSIPIDKRWPHLYNVDLNTGCWVWAGHIKPNGYGQLSLPGHQVYAHRFSYQWFIGEIPSGLHVCHHCDNASCVNPGHLFLGTPADNMQDASRKGRIKNGGREGVKNSQAFLTEKDIKLIRACSGFQRDIAEQFGVTQATISKILTGRTWSHLK